MAGRKQKSKKPSGTKAERLLRETTFFVDRALGVHVGFKLREEGWRTELHRDYFAHDEPDAAWLPEVARKGWVVLTKDKQLRYNEVERDAIQISSARVFTLARGNHTKEEMADIFLQNGPKMARFMAKNPPPFIAKVSSSGIKAMEF